MGINCPLDDTGIGQKYLNLVASTLDRALLNFVFHRLVKKLIRIALLLSFASVQVSHGQADSKYAASGPDFVTRIQPILERNCVRCHNADKDKGSLRLDTYEEMMKGGAQAEAVVPGDPEKSDIIVRTHLRPIDEGFMPDEGQILTHEELDLLTAWVKTGAKWPKGVTLTEKKPEPVKRVAMPKNPPANASQAAAYLDDILMRENANEKNLFKAPSIDDMAFLRRATLDLIGRIPTMEEFERFEKAGKDRRVKLVEELLTHERFSDRWTIFYADMLRIRSNLPGGNSLLGYVNKSIEQSKPYDKMVHELISASGRPNSNPAVGYILGDNAEPMELAAATSQIFLGVRLGCAMCHDHPFDDWQQKDFYDLAAFFGKTKRVQGRNNGMVYATEGHEMMVMWPPEDKAQDKPRRPVAPTFPFTLTEYEKKPHYLVRFEAQRKQAEAATPEKDKDAAIDALLDGIDTSPSKPKDPILAEAKRDSKKLNVHGDLYRTSELRDQLAGLVTSPRNGFFARAFVNRVWAELMGHGFVEPLDNFSDYTELRHATTLDYLAQEFIASGYELRSLIRIIMLSDAYQLGHAEGDLAITERERAEKNFTAAPMRRMLSEALYDSVVVAGHLSDYKWPAGANIKTIERQIRVPTGEMRMVEDGTPPPTMQPSMAPVRSDGYDLESSLELDFDSLLSRQQKSDIASMKTKSDEQIQAEKMAAMAREQNRTRMIYRTEIKTEKIDDNPRFSSAMRMATPAPPAHFLRVFGQPTREGLGEFREDYSSLRQQLMMLNGRLTNEAARVGPKEPIYKILQKDEGKAIEWAYLEILTRKPDAIEVDRARTILSCAPTPADGMADLRWALLNSHEFRYLP